MMKHFFLSFAIISMFLFSNCNQKKTQDENFLIAEKLSQIEGLSFITETGDSTYKQCFRLEIEQPLNHNDPNSATFNISASFA